MRARTRAEVDKLEYDLADVADRLRQEKRTAEELSTQFVREAIMRGIFGPGDKLNQDGIAQMLGISRIPVRASLRQLEGERLVTFEPFRGAAVTELSPDQIAELYELRVSLECLALQHVAGNLGAGDLEAFRVEAMRLDGAGSDPTVWVDQRRSFYSRLYELSGRPRLAELILMLRRELGPYLAIDGRADDHGGHGTLLELLAADDVARAQDWLRSHLLGVSERLQAVAAELAGSRGSAAGL